MDLLKWKTRLSNKKNKNDFEKSLPHRLKGVVADIRLNNFQAAQEQLLDIVNRRDEITDPALVRAALHNLSATWYLQDQYREGIEFFSNYIERYPADAGGYSARGMMFWYSGEYQKALQDYTLALELLPNDFLTLSARGQVLGELGQYREALLDLDQASKALDRYHTSDFAWRRRSQAFIQNGRATALAGMGEFEQGLREFESSITLCPNNAWVYYRRACVYDSRGERRKAISDYKLALVKNDPRLPLNKIRHAEARHHALVDDGENAG